MTLRLRTKNAVMPFFQISERRFWPPDAGLHRPVLLYIRMGIC